MADLFETYALRAAQAFAAANREEDHAAAMALRKEAYRYVDLLQALRKQALETRVVRPRAAGLEAALDD